MFVPTNAIATSTTKTYPTSELPILQRLWYCPQSEATVQKIQALITGDFTPSLDGIEAWNTCLELGLI
jgi:hypothetical protein